MENYFHDNISLGPRGWTCAEG